MSLNENGADEILMYINAVGAIDVNNGAIDVNSLNYYIAADIGAVSTDGAVLLIVMLLLLMLMLLLLIRLLLMLVIVMNHIF